MPSDTHRYARQSSPSRLQRVTRAGMMREPGPQSANRRSHCASCAAAGACRKSTFHQEYWVWVQSASQGADAALQCTLSTLVQLRKHAMADPGSNSANPAAAGPGAGAHQPEAPGDLQRDARAPEHAELAHGLLP